MVGKGAKGMLVSKRTRLQGGRGTFNTVLLGPYANYLSWQEGLGGAMGSQFWCCQGSCPRPQTGSPLLSRSGGTTAPSPQQARFCHRICKGMPGGRRHTPHPHSHPHPHPRDVLERRLQLVLREDRRTLGAVPWLAPWHSSATSCSACSGECSVCAHQRVLRPCLVFLYFSGSFLL